MVADDVVGVFFRFKYWNFSEGIEDAWYFALDILEWSTWKEEHKNIKFNEAILIYPFL